MSKCCDSCEPVEAKDKSTSDKLFFRNQKMLLLGLSVLIVIILEVLSFTSIEIPAFVEWSYTILLLLAFGRKVFISGVKKLIKFDFSSINLLMSVAVIGALFLGKLEEAVIITVLFALAEELENIGMKRSKKALEELVDKTPKLVQLKNETDPISVENVKVNSIFTVKPGDIIPLDGIVVSGTSSVDEATITGESVPKAKVVGSDVYAGTQNMNGALEIKVTKEVKDTTIAKIINLTAQAMDNKSRTQEFIEKFSAYYTPIVLVLSFLIITIPVVFLKQSFDFWFLQGLTLLIISCPCSLVISTPMAVFAAMGNANKKGILVRGGRYLEAIGSIKAIAFDKTRTLTKGEIYVSKVIPLNGYKEEEILRCAGGLEHFSEHPLAAGVLQKIKELAIDYKPVKNFSAVSGKGVKGDCYYCNTVSYLGSPGFIKKSFKLDEKTKELIAANESNGKTVLVIGNNERIQGLIIVEDEIKDDSKDLITFLNKEGIRPIMLTGDNGKVAAYVGTTLGIKEIYAALLPENKSKKIYELTEKYQNVAMVGDGVNDAPALALATVGIAMGAAGSDVAIESADVAIMDDNISKLKGLIYLGRKTKATVRTNIAFSLGIKSLFVILAMTGQGNLVLAILADVGVTIVVILNSLRLFRVK